MGTAWQLTALQRCELETLMCEFLVQMTLYRLYRHCVWAPSVCFKKGVLQGAQRGICRDACRWGLVITLTGAPEVFCISKEVGTLGAHSSSPAPSATYRPEPIPGLAGSPAGLGTGSLLGGSPVAPTGGIRCEDLPTYTSFETRYHQHPAVVQTSPGNHHSHGCVLP